MTPRWQTRPVHRLYPLPPERIDAAQAARGQRSAGPGRPWVMLNMVASIDGAAAVDGLSRGLSNGPDRALFGALRSEADVVLVGARTANAERYGPARQPGTRIAVVSGSLSVDPDLPLFGPADQSAAPAPDAPLPLVATTDDADPDAAARLAGRAELVRAGAERVDLPALVQRLGSLGARVVLCEGGPALNAGLFAADLVDEINLTHAPLVVSDEAPRIAAAPAARAPARSPRAFELEHVIADDGVLFVRWTRPRG